MPAVARELNIPISTNLQYLVSQTGGAYVCCHTLPCSIFVALDHTLACLSGSPELVDIVPLVQPRRLWLFRWNIRDSSPILPSELALVGYSGCSVVDGMNGSS